MKTTTALLSLVFSVSAFAANPGAATSTPDPKDVHMPNQPMAQEHMNADMKGALKPARVFFIEPKDGATVPKTFPVKMGVEGIKIRPAGEAPDEMTSGHHHLIIDSKPAAAGEAVPMDDKHMHFGKGQTETTLTLPPGKHTLILQFADGAHRSFGPKLMQKIEITVK